MGTYKSLAQLLGLTLSAMFDSIWTLKGSRAPGRGSGGRLRPTRLTCRRRCCCWPCWGRRPSSCAGG